MLALPCRRYALIDEQPRSTASAMLSCCCCHHLGRTEDVQKRQCEDLLWESYRRRLDSQAAVHVRGKSSLHASAWWNAGYSGFAMVLFSAHIHYS